MSVSLLTTQRSSNLRRAESRPLLPPNFSNQGSSSVATSPTKGNISNTSPVSKTDEKRVSGDVARKRYFKCQGIKHLQADCPDQKAIIYIRDQLTKLENDDDKLEDNHKKKMMLLRMSIWIRASYL